MYVALQKRGFCVIPEEGSYRHDTDTFIDILLRLGAESVEGPCINGAYGVTFADDPRSDEVLIKSLTHALKNERPVK